MKDKSDPQLLGFVSLAFFSFKSGRKNLEQFKWNGLAVEIKLKWIALPWQN